MHRHQIGIQRTHESLAVGHQLLPPRLESRLCIRLRLQTLRQRDLFYEDHFRQRPRFGAGIALLMRLEELEISTVIKDQKTALSFVFSVDLIRAHKMRAESCTTSDHLPELRF